MRGFHSNDESALVPTMISTATNFCLSGLFGCMIFNEKTTLLWWLGLMMVLSGMYLIIDKNSPKEEEEDNNKKEN